MSQTEECPVCKSTFCFRRLERRFIEWPIYPSAFILSHRIRRMQVHAPPPPVITKTLVPTINDRLPSPGEQADNLILWVGDHQPSPAQHVEIMDAEVGSSIGTSISSNLHDEGLAWLLQQTQMQRLIKDTSSQSGPNRLQLTFEGWQRYEALMRAVVEGRKAFMAMKFCAEMHGVFDACFRPAVKRTGFELERLIDGQSAGLIDDQLRVALRTSRFVIADLTHGNYGAYWEAGFAEGLGRPVIYTCHKNEWEENPTHFDTNHLTTIIWDETKLVEAENSLVAMIRATLPAEAKMSD